jgi:cell division protein FtsA
LRQGNLAGRSEGYELNFKDFFALDLGTTKFCIARLSKRKDNAMPQIETVCVEAAGMHRGMLSNMEEASQALAGLIDLAERRFATDLSSVVVGIAGSHLVSKKVLSKIRIPTARVEPDLLPRLAEQAMCDQKDALREIIHCIPVAYQLDGREWLQHPTGFSGDTLTGEFFMIEADKHYLSDVVRLCNQNGLEVRRLIAEPYASASVTCTPDVKKVGIVVADIGGGTTDGIIFQDEKPVASFTVNIGGKMMTRDLSIGLGIPYEEAEKVKLRFGVESGNPAATIEVLDVSKMPKLIEERAAYRILAPRIYELAKMISAEIRKSGIQAGAGVILTGGGSEILDVCPFMTKVMGVSVAKISPSVSFSQESMPTDYTPTTNLASKYATVSGLIFTEFSRYLDDQKVRKSRWAGHYFGQFVNWLKELS